MANESRVFRLPAGMSTQVVANAVSSFLSSAKGMEVQSAETTEGYVVQGRQSKDGWKTVSGMRLATTVQMIRMDDNLNVTVGQGEWSDKIGAGALGWFIAWPLAVTAGVGAYKQKKLPEEIFQVIEQCIVSGGRSVVVRNAGAELNAGMVVCPACKTQCAAGAKFCNNCGAKLENKCPSAGRRYRPEAASAEHAEHRFPRRALRCDKGRRLRMRREKTAGAAKRRMAFQYAAGGMPDDRGPSPVRFGGGGICAREPPLVGLPKPGAVGSAGGSGLRRQL